MAWHKFQRFEDSDKIGWHDDAMTQSPNSLPPIRIDRLEVFPKQPAGQSTGPYIEISEWIHPVTFFVGRNGSGKSRTAKTLTRKVIGSRLLDTDRLVNLMSFNVFSWGAYPTDFKGVPLGESDRTQMKQIQAGSHFASGELYSLREQPDVWLKVAAFLKRTLGRTIQLRESSGYLDPYVLIGGVEYSLLRDEGHGLRELVILLAAAYRDDWNLLMVDEPELHLHPSMARLWLAELRKECIERDKRALIVTHEPSLLRVRDAGDLGAIWYFQAGQNPASLACALVDRQRGEATPRRRDQVSASLKTNPDLVSQLVFSPRPVLVEGVHDVAALSASLERTKPSEVVAQTDLALCGSSAEVALWFEIAHTLGIDIRAVADLDACLEPSVQRVMDSYPEVTRRYADELFQEPPRTTEILKPLITEMKKAGVSASPKDKADWLARSIPAGTAHLLRKEKLLAIWRDHGMWLHEQGTIENVLGIETKGLNQAAQAASTPGPIDAVVDWCAYELDLMGDIELLLNIAVERVAHSLQEAIRADPSAQFTSPVGASSVADSRLVEVIPRGNGFHRLVVRTPKPFVGYWLDFSRDTAPSQLNLKPPE
ncbi:AAA family ATPase [Streptomyces aureus]|uniref:AAA family ATPase n=1 Tax=Streptomyces aureus TaxID=193461 RepID=UPI00340587B0